MQIETTKAIIVSECLGSTLDGITAALKDAEYQPLAQIAPILQPAEQLTHVSPRGGNQTIRTDRPMAALRSRRRTRRRRRAGR